MEIIGGKRIKVTKIIQEGFLFNERLSLLTKDLKNLDKIEEVFSKLILPTKDQYEIIKNVQLFSEVTFHSFKRISIPNPNVENSIIFCCSSVSPNTSKSCIDESFDSKISTDNSIEKPRLRNCKRENSNPCPMRLKFLLDVSTEEYKICESSNFDHNHSRIANDSEVIFFLILLF